jgi:hypothetical protein
LKRNNTTAVTETVGGEALQKPGSIQEEENETKPGMEEKSSDKTDNAQQTVET